MTPATIDQARVAKAKVAAMLECLRELRGVGIAVLDGGFGVKVNVEGEPSSPIPSSVDDVPVIVEIVGEIRPR